MNNFGITLKKFLTNKNTVTIIGIIVILILLYWGYDRTVKKSVNPINVLPLLLFFSKKNLASKFGFNFIKDFVLGNLDFSSFSSL